MINDIKMGFKIAKYGINTKTVLIMGAIFMALGIVMELTEYASDMGIGGLYIVLCGLYPYQMIITPSVAALVGTSPYRKKLHAEVPIFVTAVTMIFCFTLFIGVRIFKLTVLDGMNSLEALKTANLGIITLAFLAGMMMIYNSIAFKNMIIGMIALFAVLFPIMFSGFLSSYASSELLASLSFPAAIGISYVILAIGWALSYVIARLLAKYPLDPRSYKAALTKAYK